MAATSIIPRSRVDKLLVETSYKTGKYLTFRVARQDFAMSIASIRSILPVHQMTPIVGREWVCGIAAIGGREFPVIDLRRKLGIPRGAHGREPFIIVVLVEEKLAGFIADRVSAVLDLRGREFRNGAVRTRGRVRKVLDPAQIMTQEDWSEVAASVRF
jgi:purine-binding chemotaxis protein CheW